ncbi:hypothetical protein ABTF16_22505, partial [Acinetobacter baumannii]
MAIKHMAACAALALAMVGAPLDTAARKPIPIQALSEMPAIQSVSMSADGRNIVALLGKPGAEEYETLLATWDLDKPDKGPTIT